MKENIVQLFRYVNKFGLLPAIKIFYKTRLSKKQIETVNYRDLKLQLRPSTTDVYAFDLIFLWEEYKLSTLISEPKLVIDCGANIGLSAVYFCSKYPQASIYCIEPAKENVPILTSNVSNYPNVKILPNAVMSSYQDVHLSEAGLGQFDSFKVVKKKNSGAYTVKSVTVNDVLAMDKSNKIDILKIDIEGSEKDLFSNNFSNWLPKTKIVIIELHDRIEPGSSKAFFKAIVNYDFDIEIRNESIIAVNRSL